MSKDIYRVHWFNEDRRSGPKRSNQTFKTNILFGDDETVYETATQAMGAKVDSNTKWQRHAKVIV